MPESTELRLIDPPRLALRSAALGVARWFSLAVRWCLIFVLLWSSASSSLGAEAVRSRRFQASDVATAETWQEATREKLYELMMGGRKPNRPALEPRVIQRIPIPAGGYTLEEVSIATLPGRRITVWMSVPTAPRGRVGAVLALHDHGGRALQVVRGEGPAWFGRAFAEMGYVVIAPEIGSHTTRYPGWTLMGERTWDALRCLDYLATLPYVDTNRLGAAGLSLGGETAMYAAALDERLKVVMTSGWLSTVANLKQGHCPCWKFPGLEENFDFSDVFACIAPRTLICEVGELERAAGGFPVPVAQQACEEIRAAYAVFGAGDQLRLSIHGDGHVFRGYEAWEPIQTGLGQPWPWQAGPPGSAEELLRRGELARRCFVRATGVLESWWPTRDPNTGLFPRTLTERVWAPPDNGAHLLPFQIITAELLLPSRSPDLFRMLRTERTITSRLGPLPDWVDFTNQGFLHLDPDLNRSLFGAAEYAQDGLIPLVEMLGRGAWTDRLTELLDGVFAQAAVASDFGNLPADDSEVNGNVLQASARLFALTREPRYLEGAMRIGDAYCLEVLPRSGFLPPYRWNFQRHAAMVDELNLNENGNEIVAGLAELFALTIQARPLRTEPWRPVLHSMFQRLLEKARNEDGLWFNTVQASTGAVLDRATPATWGYALTACLTFANAVHDETLAEAPRRALRGLKQPRYLDWNGADSYADAMAGALPLLNRLPEPQGFAWLERILPLFFSRQRDNGMVEGWFGDGHYARTALMVGQYFTQGARCRPWRADLRLGAMRDGAKLKLALSANGPWEGRVLFDVPRHQVHLRLPNNYARLNEFPEWFTIDPKARYRVRLDKVSREGSGFELVQGVPVTVKPGSPVLLEVEPR